MKKYIETKRVPGATHIKIEVYYSKGGLNCFTYRTEKRGLYLGIGPVQLQDRPGGYQTETYGAFSGVKFHLKELKRKSDKALQEVVTKLEPLAEQLARAYEGWGADGIRSILEEVGL